MRWLGLAIGVLYAPLLNNFPHYAVPQWVALILPPLSVAILFAPLSFWSDNGRLQIMVWFAMGLAVGVIADGILDEYLHNRSRNLLPLEILFWLIFLMPAAAIGNTIGWWCRKCGIQGKIDRR
jgi:hypothetical protein